MPEKKLHFGTHMFHKPQVYLLLPFLKCFVNFTFVSYEHFPSCLSNFDGIITYHLKNQVGERVITTADKPRTASSSTKVIPFGLKKCRISYIVTS